MVYIRVYVNINCNTVCWNKMASEAAGDLPSPKHSRVDDVPRRGEKGKGVQRQGSSKVKGPKNSSAAESSAIGREKGNCEKQRY